MALINCPECGKEISDNANKCVNCGCPIIKYENIYAEKSKKKKNSIVVICKWKEKVVTYDMCEELFKTMDQAKIRADYYYLFSSKTFDDRLKKEAEAEPRIVLVDINSL